MVMAPVSSSNLESVGYENGTLYIRFRKGGLYAYYNVPEPIYKGLMMASSHGRYFHAYIKGQYGDTKIG